MFVFLVEISVFIVQARSPGSEQAEPQGWLSVMGKLSLQTPATPYTPTGWAGNRGPVLFTFFFAPPFLTGA